MFDRIREDIATVRERDPAARSALEIFFLYPGMKAVRMHRRAHWFYRHKLYFIARAISQRAVRKTGIEIHPAATLGRRLFIDHGTGVVIGETCIIGERVKLYQGVTLGAKSFDLDEEGNPVKGVHRHPRVGNNVVIYAGATILGGDTCIGDNSVIGGSVWLTRSVPAGSRIYNK